MTLEEKIKEAEATFKLASEMSQTYYDKPLIICYSGGKDSDVLLDIAKRCLKTSDFEVLNSHTTADAPETVYHIREVFKRCESEGIKTEIKLPRNKNSELTSIWKLIEEKGVPPTRTMRYCCDILKEQSTPNRMVALGVRESESRGREGRNSFGVRGRRKADGEWRSLQHTYAMFKLDQEAGLDAYQCKMIEACKANKDTLVNPIYEFTLKDIWEYIEKFDVQTNPLYARGYERVGCIGCPLAGARTQRREFADFPKYKDNYIRAFERMIEKRKEKGKPCDREFTSGEAVFKWWLGENPNQITFEDLLKEEDES